FNTFCNGYYTHMGHYLVASSLFCHRVSGLVQLDIDNDKKTSAKPIAAAAKNARNLYQIRTLN
ncbi:MAG: hypothetical protein ACRERV_02235, partial [Methylococcales bacterium]